MVADSNWPINRFGQDMNRAIPAPVQNVGGTRVYQKSFMFQSAADEGIPDAPTDNLQYGRQNGDWTEITQASISGILPVAKGGTGSGTAPVALSNLGAVPIAGGSMTGPLILSVAIPATSLQAAPKQYVDSLAAGLAIKVSVTAASTGNVNIASAPASLNGVAGVANDRWLLKDQTLSEHNGIYIFASAGAPLTRAPDLDNWSEAIGAFTFAVGGSVNPATGWVAIATAGGILDTTPLPWTLYSTSAAYTATAPVSLHGNTFTIDDGAITEAKLNAPISSAKGGTGQDFHLSTGVPVYTTGTASIVATTSGSNAILRDAPNDGVQYARQSAAWTPVTSVISFATRTAAATATIVSSTQYIQTGGFSTIGDLGAAFYKKVGGTTSGGFQSADGAWWQLAVVNPNVRMFGAKGDDSHNDSSAILDCVAFLNANGGGNVVFPPGTYQFDQTIVIDDSAHPPLPNTADRIGIIGAGSANTMLRFTRSDPSTAIQFKGNLTDYLSGAGSANRISGFTLIGANQGFVDIIGISINVMFMFEMEDIEIVQFYYGMKTNDLVGMTAIHCRFNFLNYGIDCSIVTLGSWIVSPTNEVCFFDCHWGGIRQHAFYAKWGGPISFYGGSIEGAGYPGSWTSDAERWGIRVENLGLNSGGLTVQGMHFEGGAGQADIWIKHGDYSNTYNIQADFVRLGGTLEHVTNNILVDSTGTSVGIIDVHGCSFRGDLGFVESAAEPYIKEGIFSGSPVRFNLLGNLYQSSIAAPVITPSFYMQQQEAAGWTWGIDAFNGNTFTCSHVYGVNSGGSYAGNAQDLPHKIIVNSTPQVTVTSSNTIITGILTASKTIAAGTGALGPFGTVLNIGYDTALGCGITLRPTTDIANSVFFFNASAITVGSISHDSSATAYNTTSSADLKKDLKSFDAGSIIDSTEVYDFAWKSTGERAHGVMAQQANEVYPLAVTHDEKTDWWGVDYSKYVPLLLQELKTLRGRVADLEAGSKT